MASFVSSVCEEVRSYFCNESGCYTPGEVNNVCPVTCGGEAGYYFILYVCLLNLHPNNDLKLYIFGA